jgi:hypothetical protein
LPFSTSTMAERWDSLPTRRGMVSRRRAATEGGSARLKKAIRHPPDDHVIIVFDAV